MKIEKKYIILFISSFVVFSLLLFLGKLVWDFYFYDENSYIEEHFIEPIALEAPRESLHDMIKEVGTVPKTETKQGPLIGFHYLPNGYAKEPLTRVYTALLSAFYYSDPIYDQLEELHTYFYETRVDTRGRMKNKKIHIFDPTAMPRPEFLAVSIHEFGHFLDLYILKKQMHYDVSNTFYNISWISSKKLKAGARGNDFVSGYAMTNKYEDFAESFAYYVIHNKDFLERAKQSKDLQKKYDFFANYVFRNGEFQTDVYKTTTVVKKYYWDTTKIEYSLSDFLRYLESGNLVANFSQREVN